MTALAWAALAGIVVGIAAIAVTEYRRYRWLKRNRRGGFVHPTGKRRL